MKQTNNEDTFFRLSFFLILICTLANIKERETNNLFSPIEYYKSMTGKNTRSILCEYIGRLYGIKPKVIHLVKYIINECHNSSLVIDDIQDNSITRRNYPCAHIVFGIPITLNAGYMNAFRLLHQLPDIMFDSLCEERENQYDEIKKNEIYRKIMTMITEHLYNIHIGQGLDIYWTTNRIIPCVDDYMLMIEYKTGILFKIIIDMYTLITDNIIFKEREKMENMCKILCTYFQIRDDYVNLTDPKLWKEKGFCEDFDEKKQSYLIITFYHSQHISQQTKDNFFSLFYKPNLTEREKKTLLTILYDTGIVDNVYCYLVQLKEKLETMIRIPFLFQRLYINKYKHFTDSIHK